MSSPLYLGTLLEDFLKIANKSDAAWIAARRRAALQTISGLIRIVTGGTITAENTAGVPIVSLGTFTTNDGVALQGLQVLRPDGQEAFVGASDPEGMFVLRMRDGMNADVLSATEDGLGRPYIPVAFARAPTAAWVSITSGSLTAEFTARFYRQHTRLTVNADLSVAASTTVDLDLFDADTNTVLAAVTVNGPYSGRADLVGDITGNHMDERNVSLRAARTSGVGSVLLQLASAYTVPTPPPVEAE